MLETDADAEDCAADAAAAAPAVLINPPGVVGGGGGMAFASAAAAAAAAVEDEGKLFAFDPPFLGMVTCGAVAVAVTVAPLPFISADDGTDAAGEVIQLEFILCTPCCSYYNMWQAS